MSEYSAPLRDMQFVLNELGYLDQVQALPGCEDLGADLIDAILGEAGKFAEGVLSPLNQVGDREGARWHDGEVSTAKGWQAAYGQFVEGGWNALSCHPEFGGQGLPRLVSALVEEMWNGANVSFGLCPMLTRGAIEAIELCGSPYLKETYLPKMISGEWTGTMNLTEPQAGSDLAAVRSRVEPQGDGTYRLFGQKIFITYGEHDLTDNIVHLVLARLPGAPEGVKGISLFVVPKFLVNADGSLGARNDVRCASLEHKLGIHGSPTAVLAFGDNDGAQGWLVGEENRGLEYMFIMMNAARFSVGIEGIGLSERAYQRALAYARERIQGTEAGAQSRDKVAIIQHPDVRRMLLSMKSRTEAMRALACEVAVAMDCAERHPDLQQRQESQAFVDLMIPVIKGCGTENAVDIASLGVQVHGGMGFIEETGAAQHLRDARITPIYEGTTGIQAADLVGRKIARDGGQAIGLVSKRMRYTMERLVWADDPVLQDIASALASAVVALNAAVEFIVANFKGQTPRVLAGAVPFLELFGTVAGGWQLARSALAAHERLQAGTTEQDFYRGKLLTARFYAEHLLPRAEGLSRIVIQGGDAVLEMEDRLF
ncbi:acyl-CoA dehydrogenase C-terminal domain-containing protein [Metapseudomonas resinovorans]|uniref:3-methylmercaptopropionyl-CoA dehydrogenase n=1 Tax=Metapseudomonas resinovorans NBRC 106553 TaxID=1245471 RepID=S6AW02_METRE|nr:acyl-CoA dehydrogenase C-terminal domain-containing protein [Pseudomonas resinovorans]BAN48691.1 acyl-CoA dehydrogenase AcdA [Pseudomonas resinovorans NBRC 106553]